MTSGLAIRHTCNTASTGKRARFADRRADHRADIDQDTQEAQNPSAAELIALERAKSRVVIRLLNDLRTPLMMIKSPVLSGSHLDSGQDDRLLNQADRILEGIERAVHILELDLGDDGRVGDPVDFVHAVDRFAGSLRPLGESHGVVIEYQSEIDHARVEMPWTRIEQLLESITETSISRMQEGDSLRFHIRADDPGTVVLDVSSSGSRPNGANDVDELGIAIGRRSLALHGGELMSADDRFRVVLPAVDGSVEISGETGNDGLLTHESTANAAGPQDAETTVLIVDDHAGTRAYLRYELGKHHRVLEACDGEQALEIVRDHRPDLVISDIMMPKMDGNELCRAIKSDDEVSHIPVFLVTANAIRTFRTASLESGADDYLVKPFDVKEIAMRISNEIRTRRELRQRYAREVIVKPSGITVTPEDEAFVNRAREVVEQNFSDSNFSVQDLSSEMSLSARQLQRRLRETVDQSPVEFVRQLRLQRAAQLLKARYGNVSEVAYSVGFTSLSYFAKCFREYFGDSPSVFKETSC